MVYHCMVHQVHGQEVEYLWAINEAKFELGLAKELFFPVFYCTYGLRYRQ